jgi:low temperature requirement protein LtrA
MEMVVGFISMAVMLALFIFWVWALVDILKSDFKDNTNKIVWLLVIFLLNGFGAILYYFIGRNQKS